ncbi:MAG TPA: TetR/AcrR family transcriptional regulator [Caproicibacter sp.]|nr:TetR/AcrR family transcriptional regulator [Caproicibacter sp.]
MDKKDVRIPQQKRSIEKKEKIIEAATQIFMKCGYLNTNTADIAKAAGISTGSVYAYFEDKKDILLVCLYRFGETLTQQICEKVAGLSFTGDISNTIKNVLEIFVNYHNWTKLLHDEIMSLQYIDDDVKKYFDNIQQTMMAALASQLKVSGYAFRHEQEQTFLLFQMVMGIEDELAFNHSPNIDQAILIDECVKAIVPMLTKSEGKE